MIEIEKPKVDIVELGEDYRCELFHALFFVV